MSIFRGMLVTTHLFAASAVTASGQSATPPPAAARQLDELQAGAEKRLILERQKKAN